MKSFHRVLIVAALISGILWLSATPVAAHTGFESSNPADGDTIGEPIEEIVLTFSGPAQPTGEGFIALDSTGDTRQPDSLSSDDEEQVWTLGFDPPLTGGPVGVRWKVQAPDAHPIDGAFSFTVAAPPLLVEPTESAEPTESVAETQTTTSIPTQAIANDDALTQAQAATQRDGVEPGAGADTAAAETNGAVRQDLDAFLAVPGSSAPYAKTLGAAGRLIGLTAAMIGIGGAVFAATVIRNRHRAVLSILQWARLGGAVVVLGAAIELAAQLAVTGNEWTATAMLSATALETTLFAPFGAAVGFRTLGGVMLLTAAASQVDVVRRLAATAARPGVVIPVGANAGGPNGTTTARPPVHTQSVPLPIETLADSNPQPEWATGRELPVTPAMVLAVLALLVSYTFDGHTVSEGNRWITGLVDVVHVAAGAVWAGGVFAMAWVLWSRYRRGVQLRALELSVRFSVIAGAALLATGLAGTVLAVIILDSPNELWSTSWGRLVLIKFVLVGAAAALGAYNHFIVIPWIDEDSGDETRSILLRNVVTGEAVILGVVIVITALLVGAAS